MFKTRVHEQDKHRENSQARLSSRLNNNKNKRANLTCSKNTSMNKKNQTKKAKRNFFPTKTTMEAIKCIEHVQSMHP
jgi:hypothetical protein